MMKNAPATGATLERWAAIQKTVEPILRKGDRVELIPGPGDTIKIIRIKRSILSTDK